MEVINRAFINYPSCFSRKWRKSTGPFVTVSTSRREGEGVREFMQ